MNDKVMFDPGRITPILGPVPAWSFNRLKKFEECPLRIELQVVDRIPEEDAGPAAIRGQEVHTQAEQFIKGEIDEIADANLKHFLPLLESFRAMHTTGQVIVEEQWGYTIDWADTGFFDDDVWLRLLIDVFEWVEQDVTVRVHDWKTGKGSDIAKFKYADQMMIYAVATFMRFLSVQFVETKLHFIDKPDMPPLVQRYNRQQAMQLLPRVNERALALTTASIFPPTPGRSACRFCPYNPEPCEWAYQE